MLYCIVLLYCIVSNNVISQRGGRDCGVPERHISGNDRQRLHMDRHPAGPVGSGPIISAARYVSGLYSSKEVLIKYSKVKQY